MEAIEVVLGKSAFRAFTDYSRIPESYGMQIEELSRSWRSAWMYNFPEADQEWFKIHNNLRPDSFTLKMEDGQRFFAARYQKEFKRKRLGSEVKIEWVPMSNSKAIERLDEECLAYVLA